MVQEVKSPNKIYKEQKKLGIVASDVSFKSWLEQFNSKNTVQADVNPNVPTDFTDKKMKLKIVGMNVWVFGALVITISTAAIVAVRYFEKKNRLSAA